MSKKILTIINTKIDLVQETLNTLVKKSENEVLVSPPETYQSELANSTESELVIPPATGIYEPKSPEGTPPPLSDVSSLTASDVSTTPEPETDVSEPETDVSTTPEPETDVSTTTPVPENDAFTTTTAETSVPETSVPETSVPETSVPETDASSEQKKGGKRRTHKRRNNNKNKSKNRRR
jgi:hypothetical protein